MKKTLLILGVFTSLSLFSQEKEKENENKEETKEVIKGRFFGGFESNAQLYVKDAARSIDPSTDPKFEGKAFRSNNYLPLNYNYGKWTAGLQAEAYLPLALLNFNPKYKGVNLGTYYADYKSDKFQATAGYFYEQFGSGLLLRTWEDRNLGINNSIRGGRIVYKPTENVMFTGLLGNQRTGFHVSKGLIYGFNSDISLSGLMNMQESELSLGFSYVGRDEKITLTDTTQTANFKPLTNALAGRLSYNKNSFYASAEYNYKSPDAILDPNGLVIPDFVKPGNALLANFGYAKKGVGFDATVRRMENMTFYSERNADQYPINGTNSTVYNDKIMNFIPSLTKQHHFNLANIYVYQAQARVQFEPSAQGGPLAKVGEIGGQVDFFYEFKKATALGGKYGTKVAFNAANWFNLKGTYSFPTIENPSAPLDYKTQFLGVGDKYFSDYNIEITKKLSPSVNGGLVYVKQYYNSRLITFQPGPIIKTNILAADLNYKLSHGKGFKFELQHMWASDDRGNWAAASVEYNHNSNWSFFGSDMYNYGYDPNNSLIDPNTDKFKIHFYNFGTAYKFGSTRIALSYGRQRGGLVCSGGVCRIVPPSTGLSLSVNTSF